MVSHVVIFSGCSTVRDPLHTTCANTCEQPCADMGASVQVSRVEILNRSGPCSSRCERGFQAILQAPLSTSLACGDGCSNSDFQWYGSLEKLILYMHPNSASSLYQDRHSIFLTLLVRKNFIGILSTGMDVVIVVELLCWGAHNPK